MPVTEGCVRRTRGRRPLAEKFISPMHDKETLMPIGLHDLKPNVGATHRRKRIGRGIGSGHGKTSTRGHKGAKARGQVNPNLEGGQTPLHRRLPQIRGFKPVNKKQYALINVDLLEEHFAAGTEISPESLLASGLLRDIHDGLKILGNGEVT